VETVAGGRDGIKCRRRDAPQGDGVGHDGYPPAGQQFPGHRPGGYPGGGFPSRGPAAAPVVPEAVFLFVGEIAVSRPIHMAEVFIVAAPDVAVPDDEGDGRAGRFPFENPGEDLDLVRLPPGRRARSLSGFAPLQIRLDVRRRQLQKRRAAVDDRPDGRAVGLSPGGDPKEDAGGVT